MSVDSLAVSVFNVGLDDECRFIFLGTAPSLLVVAGFGFPLELRPFVDSLPIAGLVNTRQWLWF